MEQDEGGRRAMVIAYREERAIDIANYVQQKAAKKERKVKTTKEKIVLSPEEQLLMKNLGLKAKDILALKEMAK
jgi:hypothetical protein